MDATHVTIVSTDFTHDTSTVQLAFDPDGQLVYRHAIAVFRGGALVREQWSEWKRPPTITWEEMHADAVGSK